MRARNHYHDRLAKIAGITLGVKPDVDGKAIARVNHVVEFLAKRAVRLSFGSDTPSDETYANPPGLNGWLEMRKLVNSGVSPAQLFHGRHVDQCANLRIERGNRHG